MKLQSETAVIHDGAYHLKAMLMHDGRPKIVFRSDGFPDAEITITDDGKLTFRRSTVEPV